MAQNQWSGPLTQDEIVLKLERRLGRVHAQQRLGVEKDHEDIFGHGINFFHPENWYSVHSLIRNVLKLTGLYWRGCKNSERIQSGTTRSSHGTFLRSSTGLPSSTSATCMWT